MGQDADWCRNAGVQSGFEYHYGGDTGSPCSPCYCCKRRVEDCTKNVPNCKICSGSECTECDAGYFLDGTTCKAEAPWECHHWEDGQDADWCRNAGVQSGFEYHYGGDTGSPCSPCYCCKRRVED